MDVQTLTSDRFAKQQDRAARQSGHGSTDAGLALVSRYLESTLSHIRELQVPEAISILSPEIIALVCLQVGISSVGSEENLSQSIYTLGGAAEREVYAQKLRDKAEGNKDRKRELERMEMAIRKRHSSVTHRKTAMRAAAQRAGLGSPDWDSRQKAEVGVWLLNICLATPVFIRVDEPIDHLTLTEEAMEYAHSIIETLLIQRPNMLPLLEAPAPWADSVMNISGYRHQLIRKHDKVVQATVKAAIKSGRMAPVLEAINGIQNAAYKVNHFVLDMIEWTYAEGVVIDGFVRATDLPAPEKDQPWEMMTTDQQALWKKRASDIAKINRANVSDRLMLAHDIEVAKYIGHSPFWVPANMDYRGRVYSIGNFNFQRQDHIRALFLFAEGKPLDAEGLYWLKVHVANCGDFGKVSKAQFDERVQWVDDNWKRLKDMSEWPKEDLWWTEADKPFLFLAAVKAMMDSVYWDKPCSIPVSFDGACSGLQHLAALTRCEETAGLVGLVKADAPRDVYLTVAGKAKAVIEADLVDPELAVLAQICLDYGVDRSLVKRNTMTYSYSSGQFGMAQQQYEDTMSPLADKVTEGKLAAHPFAVAEDTTTLENGTVLSRPGHMASRYLAKRIFASIKETVRRPAEAMEFLQSCARATAHEGKPLVWHTPLGLPVVLRYPEYDNSRLSLWLHDKGVKVRVKPHIQEEAKGICKTKAAGAVAPGVVHSMDACHLQQVVRMSNDAGITSVALVHDSFGCLPTDAGRFRKIIQEGFQWLYCQHDVLADIRQETLDQLDTNGHRVSALPDYGTYNPTEILEAEYAFA
jgi:DNA-directed RNA polymerase